MEIDKYVLKFEIFKELPLKITHMVLKIFSEVFKKEGKQSNGVISFLVRDFMVL